MSKEPNLFFLKLLGSEMIKAGIEKVKLHMEPHNE